MSCDVGSDQSMRTAPPAEDRTRTFARIIGPYLVVVTATAIAHANQMRALLAAFQANPMWSWYTGAFVLPLGLTVVTLHRHWRGTAAATVSALGWLTTLKGVALMAIPGAYASTADSALGSAGGWTPTGDFVMAILGAIGLYLTYVGFRVSSVRSG